MSTRRWKRNWLNTRRAVNKMPGYYTIFSSSSFKAFYLTESGRVLTQEFTNVWGNPASSKLMSLEEFCAVHPLYTAKAVLAARATGREVLVTL